MPAAGGETRNYDRHLQVALSWQSCRPKLLPASRASWRDARPRCRLWRLKATCCLPQRRCHLRCSRNYRTRCVLPKPQSPRRYSHLRCVPHPIASTPSPSGRLKLLVRVLDDLTRVPKRVPPRTASSCERDPPSCAWLGVGRDPGPSVSSRSRPSAALPQKSSPEPNRRLRYTAGMRNYPNTRCDS